MTFRRRLTIGFASIVALCAAQGVVATVGVRMLASAAEEMHVAQLTTVQAAQTALLAFERADRAAQEAQRTAEPVAARRYGELFQRELSELRAALATAAAQGSEFGALADRVAQWADQTAARIPGLGTTPRQLLLRDDLLADSRDAIRQDVAAAVRARVAAAGRQHDTARTVGTAVQFGLLAVVLAAVAVGIVVARRVGRRVAAGFDDAVAVADRVAGGDLEASIPVDGSDERATLMRALLRMRDELRVRRDAEVEQRRLLEARATRLDVLTREFEREMADALQAVASAAVALDATASRMSEMAEDGTSQASAAAGAAGSASAEVKAVARAVEEVAASVAGVAGRVTEAARTATEASAASRATNEAVSALSEGARRIGDVVRLIADVAGQTNLLALNATIEAARAGEHGKGFAVVASEVKQLASQTARATEEIGQQIAQMQRATGQAVEAIGGISLSIERLAGMTEAVAAAAAEQAATTRQIEQAMAGAAENTDETSRRATVMVESAGRTGATAAEVRDASNGLSRQSAALRNRMSAFLTEIRAA